MGHTAMLGSVQCACISGKGRMQALVGIVGKSQSPCSDRESLWPCTPQCPFECAFVQPCALMLACDSISIRALRSARLSVFS